MPRGNVKKEDRVVVTEGEVFEKLTFIGYEMVRMNGRFRTLCKCQCVCKNIITVTKSHLVNKQTKSCGKCRAKTYDGMTIEQMAEAADVSTVTIQYRLRKGLPLEKVMAPKQERYENSGSTVDLYRGVTDYTTGDRYYWKTHDTPQPPMPSRLRSHLQLEDLEGEQALN